MGGAIEGEESGAGGSRRARGGPEVPGPLSSRALRRPFRGGLPALLPALLHMGLAGDPAGAHPPHGASPPQGASPFRVKLRLGSPALLVGEAPRVAVTVTRPAYVSLVAIATDGMVHVLYPNEFRPVLHLSPGRTLTLPGSRDERAFLLRNLPADPYDDGELEVVATRHFQAPPTAAPETPLTKAAFARWLVGLPVAEWAEDVATYMVFMTPEERQRQRPQHSRPRGAAATPVPPPASRRPPPPMPFGQ